MRKTIRTLLGALAGMACATALIAPAGAAEAQPPADPSKPVTTARVGGSPADAAFREAQQKSADDYRAARTACRAKPRAERGSCMNAARAELKHARLEAQATHAAAKKQK
jgi:hypothetical protein